jgi:anti-anti-sigma regulatory factor
MTGQPLLLPGQHVCWAVESDDECEQLVARWRREGEERGEALVEYIADAEFDPQRRAQAIAADVARALAEGHPAMRIWHDAAEGVRRASDAWLDYEALVEQLCRTSSVAVLCLHDRREFGNRLAPFVRAHPRAVGDGQVRAWVEQGTVRLVGEVDLSNVDLLAGLFSNLGEREVLVDMSGLEFIDVKGTAEIVKLSRRLAPHGGVRAESAPTALRTILDLVGWAGDVEVVSLEPAG